MIKLQRCAPPTYLTPEKVIELTDKFKKEGANVWNHTAIKNSLSSFSYGKCAYCESKLGEQSSYLEVEHFKDKKDYPDDVINWDNLLPACKHCNGTKSDHDVIKEPIINPCEMNPKEHIYFSNYRVKAKTEIAITTISVLNLNDNNHLVTPRFKVGNGLLEQLEDVLLDLDAYIANKKEAKKRKALNRLKGILEECQAVALYSAVSATVVHSSVEYTEIKSKMEKHSIWDDEFERLHCDSLELCLL